ncbi:hypothetical protein [Amycolatopsis sp. cmx-11-12]|uniref:hypothetical protein n=1 Tax=Amycolatopsis sp. cmx-11-12 TaxID=2785795 RepID=UPI0039180800
MSDGLGAVVHSGEVLNDGNGWVGEAVDTAFRILDAQLANYAFAKSGIRRNLLAGLETVRFCVGSCRRPVFWRT